jgi:glycerol uptake facilitator-like aquaporin
VQVLQMLLTQKILAEIVGTFAMIFVGGGSIVLSERFPQTFPSFIIPIAWGLTIALMIFAVGHISGAHFNPAVTLAFVFVKRIPTYNIFIYWPSQLAGGLLAVSLLEVLKKL